MPYASALAATLSLRWKKPSAPAPRQSVKDERAVTGNATPSGQQHMLLAMPVIGIWNEIRGIGNFGGALRERMALGKEHG